MNRLINIAWFTFYQAFFSTLVALVVGMPCAFFCGKRNFFAKKILLSFSVVPFCVPTLIVALGYVSFLGRNGGLNRFLILIFNLKNPPVKILYSFFGLIIAQGFYNFPIIMKNVSETWERIPTEKAESARLLGASEARIFKTITIFQLLPSILSSSLLIFINCFLSFILVLLFGGIGNSTLEVEIYRAARNSLDFKTAISLGIFETSILCVVTFFYSFIENKFGRRNKGLLAEQINNSRKISGFLEKSIFSVVIFLVFLFFICPLLGIVFNAFTSSKKGTSFTFQTFISVIKMRNFLPSFKITLITSFFTAILCVFVGFCYSLLLKFLDDKINSKVKIFLNLIPIIPMCVSSVVVGVLIILIIKKGTVFSLIFTRVILSWPLAFKIIYPQIEKIPQDTMDCAKILSRNKIDTVFRIIFPQSKKTLLNAFGFCFAVSAGDTTLPLVLSIPKFETLSLFTYRLAGAYKFNEACAAGIILCLLCIIILVVSGNLFKSKSALSKKRN